MNDAELEQLIDRELKRLPTPHAPGTLLPRVLAAASRAEGPWYRRAWLAWPRGWQVASAAGLAAVVVAFALIVPAAVNGAGNDLARVTGTAEEASALVRLCWRVLLEPIAVAILALALSLSLACGALWAALERLAPAGNGAASS